MNAEALRYDSRQFVKIHRGSKRKPFALHPISLEKNMSPIPRFMPWVSLALAAALCVAGCHNNQNQAASTPNSPDQSQDPAQANLAPASYNTDSTASGPAPSSDNSQGQPPSDSTSGSYAPSDNSGYEEPPVATAPQPPPALPDYQQPPCPGDGYIWTPGYWNYAPTGYYWVPGAWVAPPYQGALWTPGYWDYSGSRYGFHPGHWGTHIGYYGGINYGFGYVGLGYEGGYWNSGHFTYNRAYNNVNTTVIHNVYNYNVVNRTNNVTRISFNGGPGGVQVRPRPVEMAASREPYAPRMSTQVSHEQSFRTDRGQFATTNQGRPNNMAISRPIQADRNVRPMPPQARGGPAPRQGPSRPEAQPQRENPGRGNSAQHGNPHAEDRRN